MKRQLRRIVSTCLSLILMLTMISNVAYAYSVPIVSYLGNGQWSPARGSLEVTLTGLATTVIAINNEGSASDVISICHDGTEYTTINRTQHSFLPSDSVFRTWGFGSSGETITVYWSTNGTTIDFSLTPPADPEPPVSKTTGMPTHEHNFTWQTIYEATPNSDGLEGEVCSCGATRNTQPISAMDYAINKYADQMIKAAKPGQKITLEFGEFNSFPRYMMEKVAARMNENITFVFKFKQNKKMQTVTIEPGTAIDLQYDWYGPDKMKELYGAE